MSQANSRISSAEEQGGKGAGEHSFLLRPRPFAPLQIILIGIVLLAFALRMFQVGDLLMWGDEGFSVFSASRDLVTITFDTTTIDPHPPLYYYLLHFYFLIAGRSELAIRFFSVFFGAATIALAGVIGKRMFGSRVGIWAAFLTALAPFAVQYSQEVRMYALAMCLTTLGIYQFVLLLERETRARWIGYAVSMFLALYTLYHTALIFLALGLVLLPLFKSRRTFVVRWFALGFGIVAAFLPWLLSRYGSAFTGIKDVAGEASPMDVATFVARGFAAIAVGPTLPVAQAFQLTGLVAGLIVLAMLAVIVTRTAKIHDAFLLFLVAIPILGYYPLYLLMPLYRGRLFALACVPLMILLARCSMIIARRIKFFAIPIGLILAGVFLHSLNHYYFNYNRYSPQVEDYLPAIRAIEEQAQPGDVVLFHAYWQQGYFLSHYQGAPIEYGSIENGQALERAVSQPRNVWAIVQALAHHDVEYWFAQNTFALGEHKFGQMRVLSYRTGTPGRGETLAAPIVFDNGMQLLGFHFNDAPTESGRGVVALQLDWRADRDIVNDYIVSVRLTGKSGEVIWAQADGQPANGASPTAKWQAGESVSDRHALFVPPGTPPGEYSMRIVVYESQTGRATSIVAPENRRGQTLVLGIVSVVKPIQPVSVIVPPNSLDARWNEIALVGFTSGADEINAGDPLPLTLYWQAQQKPASDYVANILVVDSEGGWRASAMLRPANGALDADGIWLDKVQATVDAGSAAGDAIVFVFLTNDKSDDTLSLETSAPKRDLQIKNRVGSQNTLVHAVQITHVKINARAHSFDLPSPKFPMQAMLDKKIKLLGYDFDNPNIKPGIPISLKLYWQALERMTMRYSVFVHVLDANGTLVAQSDTEPNAGAAPTTSWLLTEVIPDPHRVELPTNLAPGEYALVVGIYQAATGDRLTVDGTDANRITLVKIKISPP